MARHFIHYYFSQKLTENASYALSAIFKLYPDAYLLGRLGADLFPTEHTARLAAADPIQLFGVTARHIFTSGSKCKLSYMLGLLSHYALDRILNPYLSYFAANGVAGYFGGKVETISREEIEIGEDDDEETRFTDNINIAGLEDTPIIPVEDEDEDLDDMEEFDDFDDSEDSDMDGMLIEDDFDLDDDLDLDLGDPDSDPE